MSDPEPSVFDTDPRELAQLLDLQPDPERIWRADELGAILKHQLSAPLHVDLIALAQGLAVKLRTLAESEGLLLKSFRDLLHHPNPPVELLQITKQFAKSCRLSPGSPIPRDIASVLYFASIGVALLRCRRRITGLSDDEVRQGLDWVLSLPWVDEPTRLLLREARACLGGAGE
jgi:hypothetical protein